MTEEWNMPDKAEDWINEATLSYDEAEYQRATVEVLIGVAMALVELYPADSVPAGPISYPDYEATHVNCC